MANEGSTKPTYSELEAENLRVRGLLQRQQELAKQLYYLSHGIYGREKILALANEIAATCTPSGAESADIGKLDSVDKKSDDDLWIGAICAECENGDRTYQLHGEWIHALSEGDVPCPAMPVFKIVQHLRGSAETGGEKAAPQTGNLWLCYHALKQVEWSMNGRCVYCRLYRKDGHGTDCMVGNAISWVDEQANMALPDPFTVVSQEDMRVLESPNFRRRSQDQTVSSGVEGAHEGTTADKSELLPTQLPKER